MNIQVLGVGALEPPLQAPTLTLRCKIVPGRPAVIGPNMVTQMVLEGGFLLCQLRVLEADSKALGHE